MGRLFVFSAPSGAGKTTIIDNLRKTIPFIGYSVSHTTRTPRKNEVNGIHYHFVDKETFQGMAASGAFVEWAEVYGNLYGTSFTSLYEKTAEGLDVVLDVDSQGAKNIKKRDADSILIYVLPPSLDALKKRLQGRNTDDEKTLSLRMQEAQSEIRNALLYDFVIINDDLETAIQQARSIIISERCRTVRHQQVINELIGEELK